MVNEYPVDLGSTCNSSYISNTEFGAVTQPLPSSPISNIEVEKKAPKIVGPKLDQVQSQPVSMSSVKSVSQRRLPSPCPVPDVFSERVMKAIENGDIQGNTKLALIREAGLFYYGICPNPTGAEYDVMSRTLCDNFTDLKNKIPVNGMYWVSSFLLYNSIHTTGIPCMKYF